MNGRNGYVRILFVGVFCNALFSILTPHFAHAETTKTSQALYRARADVSSGEMRSVAVSPSKNWRRVSEINQDPLSLAQWTPSDLKCSTGAASRISLYAVDVGSLGPHDLVQRWLPDALSFQVADPERGFVIVRAIAEANRPQAVVAYPLSDQHITPLAGSMSGVKVVFVAESTTQSATQLEEQIRLLIRSQAPVRTANSGAMDVPFVLFDKEWHKTLAERLDSAAASGRARALVSKAYSVFSDADGFVPAGQSLLLKAAEAGHSHARLDLIRLSRRKLLTVEVSDEKLDSWSKALAKLGSEDAKFWLTEKRPFDEVDANIPGLDNLRKLSSCGHPEARRVWAKHLVQSFKASERFNGRKIVAGLMRSPPLEGTLPLTTRVPRAVEAPAVEELKAAALLKTSCPNEDDPEQDLFVSKADFRLDLKKPRSPLPQNAPEDVASADGESREDTDQVFELPEIKESQTLDKMVNSGSMKTLKLALKRACNWSGAEQDRDRLVIEIAARQDDAFGKWRRFRACDAIEENNMASVCRDKSLKQASLSNEARYRDLLVTAPPEFRNPIAKLRAKSQAFHEAILKNSYAVAKHVREKVEIDGVRRQMDGEFLDLVAVTLNNNLKNQIRDVVTGRRLLLLDPTDEEAAFTLKRQPASETFLKKELTRLEERMGRTVQSIKESPREDLSKDFKEGLASAHEAWLAYRKAYFALAAKASESTDEASPESEPKIVDAAMLSSADLWFHIEGIYYFELIRDREINRSRIPAESERVVWNNQE